MFKKLTCVVLTLVILSLSACSFARSDTLLANSEVVQLDAEQAIITEVKLSDYAYIRGGDFADKNWREMNAASGISELVVKGVKQDTAYARKLVLKFDLSDIDWQMAKSIYLDIKPTDTLDNSIHFNIYALRGAWDGDSVTWNEIEAMGKTLVATSATPYGGLCADLSETLGSFVGGGELSLLVERVETVANETRIPISTDLSIMPTLKLSSLEDPETVAKKAAEAEKNKTQNTLYAFDYAYVRGGSYADKNWNVINKELGISGLHIKTAANNDELTRLLLLKFDISKITLENLKSAYIDLKLNSVSDKRNPTHYKVYLVDEGWSGDSVTWNSVDEKSLVVDSLASSSLERTNIVGLVKAQTESGNKYLSLVFERIETAVFESEIGVYDDISLMPSLTVSTEEPSSYVKKLSADEIKNADYWSVAEKTYGEWAKAYEELLAKGENQVKLIPVVESEFSKTNKAKEQNDPNYKFASYKTRTLDTLDGFNAAEFDFDEYGGIKDDSLRQNATGFFYTKKLGERWWIIDPIGYPYYVCGVDVVKYAFGGSITQTNAMLAKYGSAEKWGIAATSRLKNDLGFNTASRPADEILSVALPMAAQLHSLQFLYEYGVNKGLFNSGGGSTTFSQNNTMPVFDPDFRKLCDEIASQKLAVNADNKYILGYTLDNELPMDANMLDRYLTLDIADERNHYSYAAAWNWLVSVTGKDSPEISDITNELRDLFKGFVYFNYLKTTTEAVRKYDENHLILGMRSLTAVTESEWVNKVSGLFVDVNTVNWYGEWTPSEKTLENMMRWSDTPIMITEFYVKAGDAEGDMPNTSGAGWFVETQKDRADFYQNFALRLLECKNVVGWYWLQYGDNDPNNEGVDSSSESSNKGLISNYHNEYIILTEAMGEINKNLPSLIDFFDGRAEDLR